MQVAKEEGAVAGPTATDDDKDVRRTGSFEAQGFDSPYLMNFKRTLGNEGEDAALKYLKKQGYTLLKRNYRAERCEIDLIMRDGQTVVFVEVKARTGDRYGLGREAVTAFKQGNILRAAKHYLMENRLFHSPVRFDVAEFDASAGTVAHIQNAFCE